MDQFDYGTDEYGNQQLLIHSPPQSYKSIQEMWKSELNQNGKPVINPVGGIENWYQNADQYWSNAEPSIKGVLGGLDFLHEIDIHESNLFLKELNQKINFDKERALDCGCGIGRITKDLLVNWFDSVDLVDQCSNYIEKAKEELHGNPKIKNFYAIGLQNFQIEQKYSCIWVQWVASHLVDDHLLQFLSKCQSNLKQGGFIMLKENITKSGFIVDKEDFSVTRSDGMFKQIFEQARMKVVLERMQPNFPKELFLVKEYALQPY